ncbi:hypothetical protein SBRCBS47491_009624 [Sporothrix bragantina]|uniref:Uv radiation resistance protein n=1 Tax=Sporothrix bragantina TaxID=671064 RepID=A0ABP0CXW6_9PEZI
MSFHAPPQQPFLLPQNRKLRHLRGIYLRNLTFPKPRKYSIDDAGVASSTSSPGKEKTRAGLRKSLHSRSSDDLRADSDANGSANTRNRTTTLSGATALARQHILEEALDSSTADAFFSLHSDDPDITEPLYVSEVCERAANFNFRFFDLAADLDPFLARAAQLTVKVWVRRSSSSSSSPLSSTPTPSSSWSLLVEDDIDLRFLGCIGSLQDMRFPPNALVFHLLDGVYMAAAPHSRVVPPVGARGNAGSFKHNTTPLPTSSYNALMRLANLENSLQDCLATQDKLAKQIEDLLEAQARETKPEDDLPEAEARRRRAFKGLAHRRRLADAARKKRSDLTTSLETRRAAIAAGRALQQQAWADVEYATLKLESSRATAARTLDDIRGQRRRICEDLIKIFDIVPIPHLDEPLAFQICGMPLPNTVYGHSPAPAKGGWPAEDVLSAALGFVAVLVSNLQTYLGVALPYRVTPYGSRAVVRDDISKTIPDAQREFPLYMPRGGLTAQYRFDYAWFLLNKNIETLCHAQGLKVVDIRHTLPNLKYLLYVCSAGTEELPERKKGGVRGLWQGHIQRHSNVGVGGGGLDDAVASTNLRVPTPTRNASTRTPAAPSSVASSPASTLHLPFDESATTWTLRTKGMRERG